MQLHKITWLFTILILILISFLNDEVLTKKSASEMKKSNPKNKQQIHHNKQSKKSKSKQHGNHATKVSHRQGPAINKILQSDVCPPTRTIGATLPNEVRMPFMAIYHICPKLTNPVSTKDCHQPCEGSIISTYHILTVAHCLIDSKDKKHVPPSRIVVRVGFHDLKKPEANATTLEVGATFLHKDFSQTPLTNDIALIKLKNAMTFTTLIQPVCINGLHYFVNVPNATAILPVWGKPAPYGTNSKELKFSKLSIYSYPGCKVNAKESLLQFCARIVSNKEDYACHGSSGSGLLYLASDTLRNLLLGIASTDGKIVNNVLISTNSITFTNVSSYAQWINEHVAK